MLLFMTGVFIERESSEKAGEETGGRVDKTVRCFSRSMVLVPPLEIQLDDLYVTNASQEIVRHWIKGTTEPAKAPAVAAISSAVQQPSNAASNPTAVLPSEAIQNQLVAEFSARSGMNEKFSRQCLNEFQWDFEKAAAQFLILKNRGGVPSEAFIK